MKRNFLRIAALMLALTTCSGFQTIASADSVSVTECKAESGPDLSLGSAKTPEGTTLLVSVFVDDNTYQWDFGSSEDQEKIHKVCDYMGIAADYLIKATNEYGKDAAFIYDFEENEDLCYEATFVCDTTAGTDDAESCMNMFLDENVDSDALRSKYHADNVIYFMIVNTDTDNQATTCTRNYYEGMESPYEIVFLYYVDCGCENCPAVYAHEMMHAFGAPDLYSANEEFNITEDFLQYVQTEMTNDLMFTCNDIETGDYVYDSITNDFSELDAYYAGLTDHCEVADRFKLAQSQHEK